jgi:hypothetical protein
LEYRVGLFDPGGYDPPRPPVLKTATDDFDAIRQQSRGQCIAAKTLQRATIKRERYGHIPID